MKAFVFGLLGILVLLLSLSCKHENPTVDCTGKKGTSAQFTHNGGRNLRSTKDNENASSYIAGTGIQFTASDLNADAYEWRVGTDDRVFTGKYLSLTFDSAYGKIPVKLTVHKKGIDKRCFPKDTGVDTLTQIINIVRPSESKLLGTYIGGYEDTPNDQFEITIGSEPYYQCRYCKPIPVGNSYEDFSITNIPCPGSYTLGVTSFGNDFYISSIGNTAGLPCCIAWPCGTVAQDDKTAPDVRARFPYGYLVEKEDKLVIRLLKCVDENPDHCAEKTFIGYRKK